MRIRHVNDDAQHMVKIAEFLAEVNPTAAYLSSEHDRADWDAVRKLISNQQLIDTEYHGNIFYMRKFS